jgi:deoxycytidylate deaminase
LGSRVITPTRSETAMYAAASTAGNSACLSRQVGAAVTDESGEVLAIGWNDVPRPFGDLYVTDLGGLVEFSRAIHAEMHALLTALRQTGERVRGGAIFVTTYPCHACARHLVAAGIREIHFIEPYKKSLAIKLHADAMTESDQPGKVKLIPYDGVAPMRFLSLFKMAPDSRKRAGKLLQIPSVAATPKLEKSLAALPVLESLVIESLRERSLIADDESKPSRTNGVPEHEET